MSVKLTGDEDGNLTQLEYSVSFNASFINEVKRAAELMKIKGRGWAEAQFMQSLDWAQERYSEQTMSMKEEKPEQNDDGASDISSGEFSSRSREQTSPPCTQQASPPREDTNIADAFSKVAIGK
jgi:hypothetical protein